MKNSLILLFLALALSSFGRIIDFPETYLNNTSVILSDTIPSPQDVVTNATICSTQSYTWTANGQSYSTSGTYILEGGDCESNQVLNLTVMAVGQDIFTHVTICDGENYVWIVDGQEYTVAGQYIVEDAGCESDQILNLVVKPDQTDVIIDATICEGDFYTWPANGQSYDVSGQYVIHGQGCSADLILVLTVLDIEEDLIEHTTICEGESFLWSVNNQIYTIAGAYTIELENCVTRAILYLHVIPKSPDEVTNINICSGDTYLWPVNGESYNTTGEYTIEGDICLPAQVLNLVVVEQGEDVVTNIEVCYGELYTWEVDGQSYSETGEYVVVGAGCDSNSDQVLNLFVNPWAPDIVSNINICEGESYVWSITGFVYTESGTYTFTGPECNDDQILNLNVTPEGQDVVTKVTICEGENYTWSATGLTYFLSGQYGIVVNGCSGSQILNLNVIPKEPDVITNVNICEGMSYSWPVNDETYSDEGEYVFQGLECEGNQILYLTVFPVGQDVETSATICDGDTYTWLADGLSYTVAGTYTLINGACNADQILNLTVEPVVGDVVTNATICSTDSYIWAANGQSYNVSGTYTIAGNGCSGDQVLNLTVESCFIDVWLEKAISPIGALVGDTVVFTVTVGNNGPAVATNVQVLDQLPSGYTYINSFATQGVFNFGTGLWNVGTLPVISAHTLSMIVVVNASGEYCNLAEVVGHNEQDSDSVPNDGCSGKDDPGGDDDCDSAGITPVQSGLELGNLVWNDFDNDGFVDFKEPGVLGVQVDLYAADTAGNPTGSIRQTTFTDPNGEYCFTGLTPGDYVVSIPSSNFTNGNALGGYLESTGRTITDPDDDIDNVDDGFNSGTALGLICVAVTLSIADEPTTEDGNPTTNKTVDFGVVPNGSIGNKVWIDTDSDGVQDPGEAGLPGTFVELFDLSVSSTVPIANQVTDANGNYLFTGLDAGDYFIRFTYPGNYASTIPNATNDSQDSDVDGSNGPNTTATVTLGQGQNDLTVDAGVVGGALIGNYTWIDTDGSIPNVQDSGDSPLSGVTVSLYCNDPIFGTYLVGTQVTDVKGEYYFNNVNPSGPGMTYYLEFIPPPGYVLVERDVAEDDLLNSDPDQVTNLTPPFIVNPGDLNLSFDAGYERVLSIENTAFIGEYDKDSNSANFSWTTDSEDNVDYYILEKAFNSLDFNQIATETAQGVNDAQYVEIDANLEVGTHYYRLTKVDDTGHPALSNVIVIEVEGTSNQYAVTAFPNPVVDILNVSIDAQDARVADIALFNMQGQQMISRQSDCTDTITIDCTQFSGGIYFLIISIDGEVFVDKVTIL